jgi:putative restriction endonuclease
MFCDPTPARRRLGQGGFRILVAHVYDRRCAVTGDHTLPVLEAAHIRPVAVCGLHQVASGLLLRFDIHALFRLWLCDCHTQPSFSREPPPARRIAQEGGVYYKAGPGRELWVPNEEECRPSREALEWHGDAVFMAR